MSQAAGVGLPEALERAATALAARADAIRPANGDPVQLLELLDDAAAAEVLRWLLEHEPEDAAELAMAWAEEGARGADALRSVPDEGLPKAGRKVLRRARHGLRSRGVEVPHKAPRPTVATLPPVEEAMDEAVISAIDPRGARMAYLVTGNPSGGVRMFELLLDDARGIVECRVYNAGRSRVRRLLKEFSTGGGPRALSVPPDAVRALVARVAAAQAPERALPRPFVEWRSLLTDAPEGSRTPGERARDALGGEASPAELRRAAELVRSGALGPWPPEPEVLQKLAEELLELSRSALIVSGPQRREQADRILTEALPRIFGEAFAATTAARFEEMAWILWQGEQEEEARCCLAAAAAFREGDPVENPVARAMLEVVLAPAFQKLEEEIREQDEKSRIVKA